jgi:lysophospholipase L1-like esterase
MTEVTPKLYPDLVGLKYRLPHLTEALRSKGKTKIVAIGSSSTAGVGTIVPFPHRLEQALRTRFYGRTIDVLNRGIGGQESPQELSRFESDVLAEAPTLVIWQVGTNAVYRKIDYSFNDVEDALAVGLDRLAALPLDVVLMDLQFTQLIVDKSRNDPPEHPGGPPLADDIEMRIARAAARAGVNLFQRWMLMQRWHADGVSIANMGDDSQLHTSEWATKWLSIALDCAIGAAVRPVRGARRQAFDI